MKFHFVAWSGSWISETYLCLSCALHIIFACLSWVLTWKFLQKSCKLSLHKKKYSSTFEDFKYHQKNFCSNPYACLCISTRYIYFWTIKFSDYKSLSYAKTKIWIHLLENRIIYLPLKMNASIRLVIYRERIF